MWIQSLGQEYPLEKEMATNSSILPWEIPWTEEPGRLQCMGSRKNRTRLSDYNDKGGLPSSASSPDPYCLPLDQACRESHSEV